MFRCWKSPNFILWPKIAKFEELANIILVATKYSRFTIFIYIYVCEDKFIVFALLNFYRLLFLLDSYEELSREITNKLGSALDRLRHVWDEIGLDMDQRRSRTEVVVVHLNNLLEEMVTEEEGLRDRLLKNIQKYGTDLLRLSKELGLSPYEVRC